MIPFIYIYSFLSLSTVTAQKEQDLSNLISPCHRHSPDFNACIKTTLQSMIPKLSKNGIPVLGVPRLDPLKVPELTFNYNKLSDIAGRLLIGNSTASGLGDMTVISVRSHIVEKKAFSVDIELLVPQIIMWGDFAVTGRFGLFPVSGGGPYNLTTGEVRGTWRLRGRPVQVDGVDYIKLDQFLLTPVISQFRVDAENVLRGNPQLSKMLVSFTNKFWHLLYEQSLPDFEENLDKVGQELLNKVFMKVPFDQLFPMFQDPSTTKKPAPQKASTQKPIQQKPLTLKPLTQKPNQQKPTQKPSQQRPPTQKPAQQKPTPQKVSTTRPSPQKLSTQKATTPKTTRKPSTKRTPPPTTTTTQRTTTKRKKFGFLIG